MSLQSIAPRTFFASDFHFGHANVIKHCNRPFEDLAEMEFQLIRQWNEVVTSQDVVYILGDFSFYDWDMTEYILSRLKGQKFLVKGNHDSSKMLKKVGNLGKVVSYEERTFEIGEETVRVCMSHFPFLSWHQMHRGAYHFHGHSHGNLMLPPQLQNARIFDVGVDNLFKVFGQYRPVTLEQLVEHLRDKSSASVDHHVIK